MGDVNFEKDTMVFWEECDSWVENRLSEITSQGKVVKEAASDEIEDRVENDINVLLQKGVEKYGKSFPPHILTDLHHLFFELELKKRGVKNEEQIHRHKDNGLVGLSVIQGKIKLSNALLIMEVNRVHLKKQRRNEEESCKDCICGKKDGSL